MNSSAQETSSANTSNKRSGFWPKSVGMRVAIITGIFLLLATAMPLFWPSKASKDKPAQPAQTQAVSISTPTGISFANQGGTIIINNNPIPESDTKKAIETLERKIADTNSSVSVTREDLALLSKIVKELDQRTSGITKLPDGRTQFGQFLSGQPNVILEHHQKAVELQNQGKFPEGLSHSREAIRAIEETQKLVSQVGIAMATGELDEKDRAKVYFVGAMLAYNSDDSTDAKNWAKKANELFSSADYLAVEAASTARLGDLPKAVELLKQAESKDPENKMVALVRTGLGLQK